MYVITNRAWPRHVKIGCTGDLQKRLSQFNTGSPHRDYKVAYFGTFPDKRCTEFRAHVIWARRRGGGEWFLASVREAVELLESLQ